MTTAEDVKRVLSEYIRDNQPSSRGAVAMIDLGANTEYERFVVRIEPTPPPANSSSRSSP